MKKTGIISICIAIVVISVSFIQLANAANPASVQSYRRAAGNKAARGVKNILFGWTEIPKRVVDITKRSRNPFWGATAGVFQGTCQAFARTSSGIVDVLTFYNKSDEATFVQPYMISDK